MGRKCSTHGGGLKMHIEFWWERRKERDHRKSRCMWEDNIKMDLREIGLGDMD
jgi:hypothetical protein